MNRTSRLVTMAVSSTALLVASGSAALAVTPGAEPATTGMTVSAAQQEAAAEYWTPRRMAEAVPIEQLAGDALASKLPADGAPAAGAPTVVEPDVVEPLAFPEPGGPWTGGGEVVSTTGRVFFTFQGQDASCSGSATSSPNNSVVMTAGHCIKFEGSYHTNWVFVPAYDNGDDPFGTWAAEQTLVTPQWDAVEDINYDVGAAVVGLLEGELLTDVVGGQGIAFGQSRGQPMYAFGYPAQSQYDGSQLIYCSGNTFNDPLFSSAIGMSCNMTGGSSGGPWFLDFDESTGTGLLNSVNSFGYIFLPNIMFGPYFGAEAEDVYLAAGAG